MTDDAPPHGIVRPMVGGCLPSVGHVSRPISESEFADKVANIARLYGWKIAHFGTARTMRGWRTPARYDGSGFPDWVLVHPRRRLVWFRELKAGARPNRQLDPAQALWRDWLISTGANHAVWRPDDFDDICQALSNGKAIRQ